MAIVISGVNNNDKITASDGTIDLLSGVNYAGIITAPAFTTPGNLTAGHLNIGSGIQLGNAGVATATTFLGNLTGNVNATSNLLLQIGGSEKFRVGSSGQLGIAGANYGTSGQVLTSGGSSSAATWSTITGTTINNNADNRLITGSGSANTLEGEANLTWNGQTFEAYNASGPSYIAAKSNTNSGDYGIVQVQSGSTVRGRLVSDASVDAFRLDTAGRASAPITFHTGSSYAERVRIDAGGNMNVTGVVTATAFTGDGSALTGTGVGGNTSVNTTGIITATAFVSSEGQLSNRNKIINGDFTIHQRGGTIASSNGNYSLDRWRMYRSGDSSGGFSVQQSTSSYPQTNISGVRDNFKASAFITVTSAGSAAANNNIKFQQRIEGTNVYDLAFGTAAAKKITVSFYVKCSLTGTFGASIVNAPHNRSNVQTYTINSASTWEYKTFTVDGDTSGSWDFGTGTGMQLMFDLGTGSNKSSNSTNQWLSGEYHGTPSGVKLIHTNGATWQLAGVQLEAGSVATPFEFRNQTDELQRCQRYFQKDLNRRAYWGSGNVSDRQFPLRFGVEMRDTPTISFTSTSIDGGSAAAYSVTRQGYNFAMTGSGRFYEWAHEANAEL